MKNFSAFLLTLENGQVEGKITSLPLSFLNDQYVLIKVMYSSINYKDFLACETNGGVIRNYPMIPGIDLAGIVEKSNSPEFAVGDPVIATSYTIGVSENGGFSKYASVKPEYLVKLPFGLSLKEAMILGTAGLTAALSVNALREHGLNKDSRVLITGASGGVASISSLLLEHLGVTQQTLLSRKNLPSFKNKEHLTPDEFLQTPVKLLGKQNYDFALDSVGGEILSALIPQIAYGGAIAAFGNAGGIKLETSVLPFILRGVNLLGIDSVNTPKALREEMWTFLAQAHLDFSALSLSEISLKDVPEVLKEFKNGTHIGRTIIAM